jgi:hypothetical protein
MQIFTFLLTVDVHIPFRLDLDCASLGAERSLRVVRCQYSCGCKWDLKG